jgi:hypothetical protein
MSFVEAKIEFLHTLFDNSQSVNKIINAYFQPILIKLTTAETTFLLLLLIQNNA